MGSVLLYHVIGDLTVGKPDYTEFLETETLKSSLSAIRDSTECGIPIWKKKSQTDAIETPEMRQQRFIGILNSIDVVAFLAKSPTLDTLVSDVVIPNNNLLRELDPATRLLDALEMMKEGVQRLLVPKGRVWKGTSKRFSVIYHGWWLKKSDSFEIANPARVSIPEAGRKFCCLSREDVISFLICCLGALAPIPLSSISSLEAMNSNFPAIDRSSPAIDVMKLKHDAVAVVESKKIIGEISSCKLWKCDLESAARALAKLTAGEFSMGVEDSEEGFCKGKKSGLRVGWRAPLICRGSSSLAAVMAQMLSHRATHVWVTEGGREEDDLVGVVGYGDILGAIVRYKHPFGTNIATQSSV